METPGIRFSMSALESIPVCKSRDKATQARWTALQCFCDPVPASCTRLLHLSLADWQRLLRWLDISGLALYFLHRIEELRWDGSLPQAVLARLQQNLFDNAIRTQDMIAESGGIQREFLNTNLSYAILKGFSLWPCSVPDLALRSQLDLDFLIAEKDSPAARRILESRGYRLHAVSGRSWEFKTPHSLKRSLDDLYKAPPSRCVELHLETRAEGRDSLLARAEKRQFHGIPMPVLRPADLFLGQGLHLFKHVCSEFARAAHLLEFRHHVIARHDDVEFWREVRAAARDNLRTSWALGLVTLLISRTMGDFAPHALTGWTVERLPAAARLWVETYGCRSVFADPPGSKLYLLLQRELEIAGVPAKRSLRRILLPMKLPPPIQLAPEQESMGARMRRYRLQAWFILHRLRFHILEGIRYIRESARWRQQLKVCGQS